MTVQNLRHSYLLLAFLIQRWKLFGAAPNTGWFIGRKIKAKKDALPAAHFPLPASTKTELQWVEIDYKFPRCVAPGLYLQFTGRVLFLTPRGIHILSRINWFSEFLLQKYSRNFWSCRVCPTMPLFSSWLSAGAVVSRISSRTKYASLYLGTSTQQNASLGVLSCWLSVTSAGRHLAARGRGLFSASAANRHLISRTRQASWLRAWARQRPACTPCSGDRDPYTPARGLAGEHRICKRLKEIKRTKEGTTVLLTYIRALYVTWQDNSPGWWIHLLPWLFFFLTGHDCRLLQESMNRAGILTNYSGRSSADG